MNAKNVPSTKYGANGTSLFIPYFLKKTDTTPIIDPLQKARARLERATEKPSNQPIPIASLASPKPIHRPRETSQNKAKGELINIPDRNSK